MLFVKFIAAWVTLYVPHYGQPLCLIKPNGAGGVGGVVGFFIDL